ncbi:hypothetical protein DPMN_166830 [Dreissena polymorpha]|uniref:Uncharacterized protein n=1 Tax=Dreissena polymorpha TaxID=45954 RepID=A0A9D4F098_DREPO|nr:hypothetical protein DPMN_166830 [Dreissena polymorpha]
MPSAHCLNDPNILARLHTNLSLGIGDTEQTDRCPIAVHGDSSLPPPRMIRPSFANEVTDGRTATRTTLTDGRTDGQTDGRTDGRTDGQTRGRKNNQTWESECGSTIIETDS